MFAPHHAETARPRRLAAAPAPRPRLQLLPETNAPAPASQPAPTFLRLTVGFVYFYFGFLKFFPDLSSAELLAGEAITRMTGHGMSASTGLWWLAVLECAIGLAFLLDVLLPVAYGFFLGHMVCTFLPLFIVPELCFKFAPFAPTLEGQYVLKNLILVAAGHAVLFPAVKARWASLRMRWAKAS